MKTEYRFVLLFCGFAATVAFIAFMLVPSIVGLRARQMDLQFLEARVRLVSESEAPYYAVYESLQVLCWDGLFLAFVNIRAGALSHGLDMASFTASEVSSFGMNVSETTVRALLSGCFDDAINYVYCLASSAFNVRYLSIVSAEAASIEILISIFYNY